MARERGRSLLGCGLGFQLGYSGFQGFELFAGTLQYRALNLELFPGHEIHPGQRRFEEGPKVLAEVFFDHRHIRRQARGGAAEEVVQASGGEHDWDFKRKDGHLIARGPSEQEKPEQCHS